MQEQMLAGDLQHLQYLHGLTFEGFLKGFCLSIQTRKAVLSEASLLNEFAVGRVTVRVVKTAPRASIKADSNLRRTVVERFCLRQPVIRAAEAG